MNFLYSFSSDADEDTVHSVVKVSCPGTLLLFRVTANPHHPEGFSSQIFRLFNSEDIDGSTNNKVAGREMLSAAVLQVLSQCISHPCAIMPDVIVEIYEDSEKKMQYRICHESAFQDFAASLPSLSTYRLNTGLCDVPTIDLKDLRFDQILEGRGFTVSVRLNECSAEPEYAFKGLIFAEYLLDKDHCPKRIQSCMDETRILQSIPPHQSIISAAKFLVTVKRPGFEPDVCGTLMPFMKNGSVDDQIVNANARNSRLSLATKALWAYQLASAIEHTHHKAHTYYMDIKPSNILVDDDMNLKLIDWEQSGAPLCTLVPEADESWDVEECEGQLLYSKYAGPHRKFRPCGPFDWNVFPLWLEQYPSALEAVEVYSFGRTLWMIMQQIELINVNQRDDVAVYWDEKSNDIPAAWKENIAQCLDSDPNKRAKLVDLVELWKNEIASLQINDKQ